MKLPPDTTPLYNHPLPMIEAWLQAQGCSSDRENPSLWFCDRERWRAEIAMEETALVINYAFADGTAKTLTFPYALSRGDIEAAAFDV